MSRCLPRFPSRLIRCTTRRTTTRGRPRVRRQTCGTTVLLPYEGAGHSVYGRSDCTRGAVDDYLTELKIRSAGSSCPPPRRTDRKGIAAWPKRVGKVVGDRVSEWGSIG
ncbi:alpha/beta hydrolase [Streptomyces sp. NPDC102274]|uniref:alpha/beta hydrolase n=1 Tax=Streptomyces sp. NPDC102274 TaxID=3366151 RepID=UPI00382EBA92